MKNWLYFLIIALAGIYPSACYADVFQKYNKVIWIDQENQVGEAYGQGRKLQEFPIMSGDDETPTPPGTYVVKKKDRNYYSRKYDTPMPYSLFFDLKGMRAIHEGEVPDSEEKEEWATHGCIHVEEPYINWLFDWAEQGKTVVVIRGHRVGPEEEKPDEENQKGEEQLQEKQDTETGN